MSTKKSKNALPFPVVILTKGKRLPKDDIYFAITKSGIFMHKKLGLIEATVKVDDISFLRDLRPSAKMNIPQIPREMFGQTLSLFRWVHQKRGGESVILLHYSIEKEHFILDCPLQYVSGAGIPYYKKDIRYPGYQLVISIHSHPGFGAFHSGTDRSDEEFFDGLHITVGHVDQEYFTLVSSIAVNNNRFEVNPEDVIEGVIKVPDFDPYAHLRVARANDEGFDEFDEFGDLVEDELDIEDEEEGVEHVSPEELDEIISGYGGVLGCAGYGKGAAYVQRDPYYDLQTDEGISCQNDFPFPDTWEKKVRKRRRYKAVKVVKGKTKAHAILLGNSNGDGSDTGYTGLAQLNRLRHQHEAQRAQRSSTIVVVGQGQHNRHTGPF